MGARGLNSSPAASTLPAPCVSAGDSVTENFDRLKSFLVPPGAGQHRLFHGRGGAMGDLDWLTVDCYPPVLLVTLFREPATAELDNLLPCLEQQLAALGCDALVLQHRYRSPAQNEVWAGHLPTSPFARENGLMFSLDFTRGQNIGFFADMQPARAWLAERAEGKRVLNLFAFTCAFSVVALAHGAEKVVNIDLSEAALDIGVRNHAINGLDPDRAVFLPHSIFRSWKKLHSLGRYDLIILDPPSEQKGSFIARRDYARVIRQLHRLLKPEADLLACLNAPWLDEAFLERTVLDNLPGSRRVSRMPFAPGFVEADRDAGLKVIHYRYSRPDSLS